MRQRGLSATSASLLDLDAVHADGRPAVVLGLDTTLADQLRTAD